MINPRKENFRLRFEPGTSKTQHVASSIISSVLRFKFGRIQSGFVAMSSPSLIVRELQALFMALCSR
jgi:hypothetical protein